MQTSQSAQSPRDNAPKKVLLADGGLGEHSWLLVAANVILFCCCFVLASCLGHLKGKYMTKLMKVCIGNNQRIDS